MALSPNLQKLPGINMTVTVCGKGGVGKTFVAANLAVLFAKLGKRVGLFDANIFHPNAFAMLGITQKISPTADNKIIPVERHGIKTVSMAGLTADDEPILWRGPLLSKITQQLLKETIWGELDILIIDMPSDTADIALSIFKQFEIFGALFVTTPHMMVAYDTRRTVHSLAMLQIPLLGIIENMRSELASDGGGAKLAELTKLPMIASIPARRQIAQLCDGGIPAVLKLEELEMIFGKIAKGILEKTVSA